MNKEVLKIAQMYQNEKVSQIFINTSAGQDMIDLEIEKTLTFEEINQISSLPNMYMKLNVFIEEHESYPSIVQFVKRFNNKCLDLSQRYNQSFSKEYILKLVEENALEICKKYPAIEPAHSYLDFVKAYKAQKKIILTQTPAKVQLFFSNPVDFI